MSTPSTVGVNDDLATRQTTVAVRSTRHESPRGINVISDLAVDHLLRQQRFHNLLDDVLADFVVRYFRCMLS